MVNFQPEIIIDSSSCRANLGPCPPRVSFVTGDTRHEPLTQDERSSFQPMADTDKHGAKEPTFKSKAPPSLNLSCLSVPQSKVDTWSLDNTDQLNSSPSSSDPPMMLSSDSESNYSGGVMHVYKVRPLPQVPESSSDERNAVGSYPLTPRCLRGRSCMTVTTVWSQESGHTMSQSPDGESQEAYRELIVDVVVPGVMLGDQADVEEVISRRALTPPRAHGHRPKTLLRPIQPSARLTNTPRPNSRNSGHSTIVLLPNDSVV